MLVSHEAVPHRDVIKTHLHVCRRRSCYGGQFDI